MALDDKEIEDFKAWAEKGKVADEQTGGSTQNADYAFRKAYSKEIREHGQTPPDEFARLHGGTGDDQQAYMRLQKAKSEAMLAEADAQLTYEENPVVYGQKFGTVDGKKGQLISEGIPSGQTPAEQVAADLAYEQIKDMPDEYPGDTKAEVKQKVEDASAVKTPPSEPSKPGSRTGDHLLDVIKKNRIDTFVSDSVVFQLKNGQLVNSIRTIEDLEQYVFQRISLRDLIIFSLSCAEQGLDINILKWLDGFLKALGGLRIPKFAINIPRLSFQDLLASYAANLETAMRKAIEAMIVEYIKKLLVAIASCDFKSAMGAVLDPFNDLNNFLKDPEAAFEDLGNKLLDFTRNEAGKAGLGNIFATVEEGVTTMIDPSKSKYMANQTTAAANALGKMFGQELDKSLSLKQKRDLFLGLASDSLLEQIRDKISKRFDVPKEKMKGIDSLKRSFEDMAAHVDLVAMENKIILDGEQQIVSEDTCATFKDKLRRRYANSEDFPEGVPEDLIDQIIDSLPDDVSIDPNAPLSVMDMPTEFDLDECELGVENPVSDEIMSQVLSSMFGTIKTFFDTEIAAFPVYLSGQDAPPPVPPMQPDNSPGGYTIGKGGGETSYPTPDITSLLKAASKVETILPDLKNSLIWANNEETIDTELDGYGVSFVLRNKFKNTDSLLEHAGSIGDMSARLQSLSSEVSADQIGSIFAGGTTNYLADLTSVLEEDPWFDGAKYTIHATKDPYKVTGLQKLAPDANPSKIHEIRLYHEIFGATGSYNEALTSVFPTLVGAAVSSKNDMNKDVRGEYLELPEEPILDLSKGPVGAAIPNSVWWSQLITDVWSGAAYTDETKEEQLEKFDGFKNHMANEYLDIMETIFRRYLHGCSLSKYFKPEEILGSSFTKNPFCEPPEGEKDVLGISGITNEVTSLMKKLECEGDLDAFKKATCSGLTRLYVRTLVMDWILPSIFAFSQYGAAISNGDTLFPLVFKLLEEHLKEMSSVAPGTFVNTIRHYSDMTIFEWGGAEQPEDYDNTTGLKMLVKQELENVSKHFQENGIIDVNSSKGLIEEFISTTHNEGEAEFDGTIVEDPQLLSYNTYPILKDVPPVVEVPIPLPNGETYPTMDSSFGNGVFINKNGGVNVVNSSFFRHGAFLLEKFVIADLKPTDELPEAPVVKISDNGDLLGKSKLIISEPSDYFKDVIFESTPRGEYKVSKFLKGHSNLTKFSEITNLQSNWDTINDQIAELDGKIYNILQEIVDRSRTANQFTTPGAIQVWDDTNDYGNGLEPKPEPNEYFSSVALENVDSESSLYMPGYVGEWTSMSPDYSSRNNRLVFTVVGRTLKPSGQHCTYKKSGTQGLYSQKIDEFCVWIDAQELAEHANAIMNNSYYLGTPDVWRKWDDTNYIQYETDKIHAIKKDEYGSLVKPLPWGQESKLEVNDSFSSNNIWMSKTEMLAGIDLESNAAKSVVYEQIDLSDPSSASEKAEERVKEQLRARTKEAVKFYIKSQTHEPMGFTQEHKLLELVDSLELPLPSVGSPSGDFNSILWAGEQIEAPEEFFSLTSDSIAAVTSGLVGGITGKGFDDAWSFVAKAMLSGKSLQDIFPGFSVFNNTPDPAATKKRFKIYTNGLEESVFPLEGKEATVVYDPEVWPPPAEYGYEDSEAYLEQAVIGASLVFYKLKLFAGLQGVEVDDEIDLLARKISLAMQPTWKAKTQGLIVVDRNVLGYRAITDGSEVSQLSEKYDLKYPIMPKFPSISERRFWGYGNFREKQSQVEDLLANMEYYLTVIDGYDTYSGTGADRALLFVSQEMDIAGLGGYSLSPSPGKRWIRYARTQPNLIGQPGSQGHGDAVKPSGGKSWADYKQYANEPAGYKPLSLYGPGVTVNEQGQETFINNKKIKGSESKSYKALYKWYSGLKLFAIQRRQLLEQAEELLKADTFITAPGETWPSLPINDFFVEPPEIGIRLSYIMPAKDYNTFSNCPDHIINPLSYKGYQTLDIAEQHPSVKEKSYLLREPASGIDALGFPNKDRDSIRIPLITKTLPLAEAIGSAGVVAPELSFNLQKDNPGWLMSLNNNKGEFGALEILKKNMIEAPDTKLLLEEIIPLENIITALYAYMTNSVYFYTNNKTLNIFSTTRSMILTQLASINSLDLSSEETPEKSDLATAIASTTADAKNTNSGLDAMMIMQCTLMIYKGLVETFDPAVATAKTLKDVVAEVYDSGMRTAHKLAYPDEKWCPDALSRLLRSSRLVPGYVFALQPFPLGTNTLTPLNPFLSLPYLGLALIGLDPKDKSVINMQNLSDGMCDEGEEDKQCN